LKNFWLCIKQLFGKKILDTLSTRFDYDPRAPFSIKFSDVECNKHVMMFRKIFSIGEDRTPELIWNEETRRELLETLQRQIQSVNDSPFAVLLSFDYQSNKNELKVDDIFVRNFNGDIYFKPTNVQHFVKSLVERLELIYSGKTNLTEFSEKEFEDALELLKALRNLVQYQQIL